MFSLKLQSEKQKVEPMNFKYIAVPFEIRAADNASSDAMIIEGYASVFDVIDSYETTFAKGCFDKSLREKGLPAFLLHHDSRMIAGTTLECREDARGLYWKAEFTKGVQHAEEAYRQAKQGAIKGISIGFIGTLYEEDEINDVRTFKEVELYECSLVAFPANPQAKIQAVRNNLPKTVREFERYLRESGFSKDDAVRIASKGFETKQEEQRDSGLSELEVQSLTNLINKIKG